MNSAYAENSDTLLYFHALYDSINLFITVIGVAWDSYAHRSLAS